MEALLAGTTKAASGVAAQVHSGRGRDRADRADRPLGAAQASHEAKRLLSAGYRLQVTVNVSAHQFGAPEVFDDIATALPDAGLPAELLGLELTESALGSERPMMT
jgi:EAL domain-containing protein (putative c-di-GMP-specific phosphodiesterase class I)